MNDAASAIRVEWVVLALYLAVGQWLGVRARKHLKEPTVRRPSRSLMWRPELFTKRGNELRRQANAFAILGLLAWAAWLIFRQSGRE
jgi:hypothetical protein